MNTQTPTLSKTEPADVPHWARPLVERQLALLGRLAEAGLEIVVALEGQATGKAAETAPVAHGDIALAYARVSRAVRLTVALQSKLIADLQALEEAEAQARDEALFAADNARKARVEAILERVIKAEHADKDEEALEQILDRLVIEAGERLDQDDIYGDVLARPVSEIVADICRDLGLSPDWPRLAEEA